ncbi:RloB family protein [Clostridium sp. Marseille-Q2269]|uniref:RloB family protein n=1 Tax=Clostridium sp. Marseille-Q2269 TaxID=2942205 RepID=UPI00207485B0|nr:RloB family protein [Clostridium sp. Marseille-Q2269]
MKLNKRDEGVRKKGRRKVNPTIVIICEGKETEVDYFKKFNSRYTRVDVRVADKNSIGKNKAKATDPESLVDKALYIKENDYDINPKDGDRVWCIFDVDIDYNNNNPVESKIQQIERAKKRANNKIILGISNPCFEFWYLLHFEYTTANLKNYNSVIKKLNKYIKDYEKNKSIYDELKNNIDNAVKRSLKLKEYHESLHRQLPDRFINNYNINVRDFIQSNPYTNIGDLVQYIDKLGNK